MSNRQSVTARGLAPFARGRFLAPARLCHPPSPVRGERGSCPATRRHGEAYACSRHQPPHATMYLDRSEGAASLRLFAGDDDVVFAAEDFFGEVAVEDLAVVS